MVAQNNNVIVLTEMNFSSRQGASFSRLNSYAKATELSHEFYLTSWWCKNMEFGKIGENLFASTDEFQQKKSKFFRVFVDQFTFVRAYRYVADLYKTNKTNAVYLLYSHNLALILISLLFLHWNKKANIIIEKNELDLGILGSTFELRKISPLIFLLSFPPRSFAALLIDMLSFFFPKKILISKRLLSLYKNSQTNWLIPPLVDTTRFVFCPLKEKDTISILYAGSISLSKDGLIESINAIAQLNDEERSKISFHIYGLGSDHVITYVKQLIRTHNLTDNIFLHPAVPFSEMSKLYEEHDILLMPRRPNLQNNYGFSTKMVESLACGRPVIVTNVSDNGKFITNLTDSYLIDEMNVPEIARTLRHIIESRNHLSKVSENAHRLAETHFSVNSNKEKLQAIFSS
jgi:glycosyltransferase involved in cell wall biosynthesis